jgi:hypothetical protein
MEFLKDNKNINIFFLILFLLLSLVAFVMIMAAVPPVSRDELTHHLAISKLYIEHGGIFEIPNVKFSYYPMNIDLLYLIPLYFKNDILPKYIHFLFALLTAIFIYRYLKKYAGRNYGLLGALFFLSTPIIVKLSITAYVDLGLVFFSWLCIYFFLKWYSNEYKLRYVIYAGIACGLALGSKYNGLLTLFIMVGLTPLLYSLPTNQRIPAIMHAQQYRNSLRGLGYGLLFIMVALIFFSPWMIRNYVWTQNPIYPLYKNVLQAESSNATDSDMEEPSRLNPFQHRRLIYHESLWGSTLIPIRIFFQGRDDNPKYFDGKLNPFLLFLPILAFWKSKNRDRKLDIHKNILLTFTILFLMIALFTTDMRIRYISPAIPPLVVLSMIGLKRMMDAISEMSHGKNFLRILISFLIIFAFFLNGKYIGHLFHEVDPFSYLLKKVSRHQYISRFVGEYPVLQYANLELPKDAKVLCLFLANRTYYLDRECYLDENFFRKNQNGQYEEEILLNRLKQSGATHIILWQRSYENFIKTNLNSHEVDIFEKFFHNHTKILYEKNRYQLREVINKEEA